MRNSLILWEKLVIKKREPQECQQLPTRSEPPTLQQGLPDVWGGRTNAGAARRLPVTGPEQQDGNLTPRAETLTDARAPRGAGGAGGSPRLAAGWGAAAQPGWPPRGCPGSCAWWRWR